MLELTVDNRPLGKLAKLSWRLWVEDLDACRVIPVATTWNSTCMCRRLGCAREGLSATQE